MGYSMSYNFCALALMMIILFMYLRNYRNVTLTKQHRIYKWMLILHLSTILFDISISTVYPSPSGALRIFLTVCGFFFFAAHNLLPFLYAYYITTLTSASSSKTASLLLKLPLLIPVVLISVSPFLNVIYYFDENCTYHRGPLLPILYVVAAYYLIYGCIHVHRFRNIIKFSKRNALYSFVLFSLLPVLVQFFVPSLVIEQYAIAICLLLIYLQIERPGEFLDAKTGTLNQHSFRHTSKLYLKTNTPFQIVYITLDHKSVNSQVFGDSYTLRILKMFAGYLQELSPGIAVYRVSDRTFALLLPKDESGTIPACLMDIRNRLAEPFRYNVTDLFLNAVICFMQCPEDASDLNALLSCIDILEDKKTVYNNEIVYARDLNLNIAERHAQIELALQRALQEHSFEVYYQPIFSTKEQKVISAEALLRLNDPVLGFISPEEFIPIAEENGMIIEIGNFVLHSVCKFIKENNIEKYGIHFIEVNLSVIQCMQMNMAKSILELTKQYGLSPSQINLEITETAATDSTKTLKGNMKELVDSAVTFSLDDYGTGYSNVSYIMQLPFQMIKLDKSMVWSSFEDSKASIAFESTVAMIQKLGMHIVAEGVETYGQADFLTSLGIEYLQGYYFAKPMPAAEFIKYLNTTKTS